MNRVTFYFDGFNFYNGLKQQIKSDPSWKAFYWLDFVKFCQQFIGAEQTLSKVKYFTAPPLNFGKKERQKALLDANEKLYPSIFEIVRGKYYSKNITCKNCAGVFPLAEEKRTDVNISVQMIGDCALDLTDTLILVSGDSDLVPPLQFIKKNYENKKVKLYFPPLRTSADLFNENGKKAIFLANNKGKFTKAVMPPSFEQEDGSISTIPPQWK